MSSDKVTQDGTVHVKFRCKIFMSYTGEGRLDDGPQLGIRVLGIHLTLTMITGGCNDVTSKYNYCHVEITEWQKVQSKHNYIY